jgi:hypothetical protein
VRLTPLGSLLGCINSRKCTESSYGRYACELGFGVQQKCVCAVTKTVKIPSSQMPPKDTTEAADENRSSFSKSTRRVRDFFLIPAPIKQLFDLVPVLTYPPNQLPLRAPKPARIPSLYVFSKDQDAAAGRPSFNPSCLKWQVSSVWLENAWRPADDNV